MTIMEHGVSRSRWIRNSILIGVWFFIFALAVAAIFDPRIRVLHIFQALIYLAVLVLTRRNSPWGFGMGALIAIFWNYIFLVSLIGLGVETVWINLRSGRPDLILQLLASLSQVLLIVACLAGFLSSQPTIKQWMQFVAGGLLAVSYFIVSIMILTGPRYMDMLKRVLHL
jgi:hypothetical protein